MKPDARCPICLAPLPRHYPPCVPRHLEVVLFYVFAALGFPALLLVFAMHGPWAYLPALAVFWCTLYLGARYW